VTVSLEITGVEKLVKALDPRKAQRVMMATMINAADIVRREFKEYPPRPTEAEGRAAFARMSDKARRYFFWALKHGQIEVPYRRGQSPGSQKLGASWTRKVRRFSRGIEGVIETNVTYAPWVMKRGQQAPIHEGRWATIEDRMEKVQGKVVRLFEAALRRAVR